ncbi:heavy metal translocating P-type ATPase [Deinococcus aerius]|uniref:Heavy metal translocating P-type ATPase n=2 Tax=Deinococcus TaxID=1298 RepID=A0A2I9D3C3_9DEIO|nr:MULTISPECIES: heavy metal translocating P-type ATPase [Deinococcus]MBB5293850.1 Cd2+/Zn2+-exporting ATPase [Deinococcus metallilatus]QBY07200.1 cadmium-translocating P-type ATPase [Deinococcus metallilatus]RXJ14672.1 cadmium-translocating P-type ATPase [Deinococcus metallilatus]TLK30792.1 cadmium-translocating P-type ATPase [Deinococcus metallilatus]GBF04690.1 heavy metal translocating P-type ATPase [Deinococcus aerius]
MTSSPSTPGTPLRYFVERMDCADCARTVQSALTRLPGVDTPQVNFTTQTLSLTLDEAQMPRERLEQTLRSLGYPPTLEAAPAVTPNAPLRYFVNNMDCADCANKVQGVVTRLPGVGEPKVNFTTQTLSLTLDETRTPRTQLEQTLRSIGYPPEVQDEVNPVPGTAPTTPAAPRPARVERPWYQTGKGRNVLLTGALLALAFVFSLVAPGFAFWAYAAATAIGTWPLLRKAVASARLGEPFTINTLISVAAIGAIAIGEAAEGALVVFLFAIGELLENVAAGRARAGIQALAALAPKTALLLEGGQTREVPVEGLGVGQLVRVQPGGRVPADGTITEGDSNLDDSPVTGESVPVHKGVGDAVYAGSINTDGVLTVRVDRGASDNTIARIIHLVEEAESSKAPTARFIDRFSRWYTPAAMAVALLFAVLPPLLFGQPWHEWIYKGVALLLIACPCALVLSVPAAVTSGISAGARRGLLIKGGAALETIGGVSTVAFDKTGTLTENKPQVTDVIPLFGDEANVLRLAAAVETGSAHPLAKAIVERAQGLAVPTPRQARAISGKAVTAVVDGEDLAVGSPRYAQERTGLTPEVRSRIEALEGQGKTVVVLLNGHGPLGLIAIRDEPRPDAREAVATLKGLGVRSLMLTGDNARTGNAIARDLGLDVEAELLPEDKLRRIAALKQGGKVAMVGDGINDAPALAQSDVGIAMGGGTDVALETADAALLRHSVTGVAELVQLSRAVMTNIRQNVAFALGLKAIFLVTTLLGITGLWPAILSDTGATVLVTANALRLLRFKPGA